MVIVRSWVHSNIHDSGEVQVSAKTGKKQNTMKVRGHVKERDVADLLGYVGDSYQIHLSSQLG
jgi:hypothetical protein